MRIPSLVLLPCISLATLAAVVHGTEKQTTLTVTAGTVDRIKSVVTFPLPGLPPQVRALKSSDGSTLAQIDNHGQAWFIERDLKAGQVKTYTLQPIVPERTATNQTSLQRDGDVVKLLARGQTVLQYQGAMSKLPREDLKPVFQ